MTKAFVIAAFLLAGCIAAHAQNAPGQNAPGQEPPPVADKGTTLQLNCVDEASETLGERGHYVRRVKLTNKCEQPLKCQAYAATYGSQGMQRTQAVLVLAPKSKGTAAAKSYEFRIKEVGGFSTSTRYCRVI
ncbi:MAG: hypothetical protein ABI830_00995 [Pseudolabrys sp.]